MGRQTSYYPDYAIFNDKKKGHEKARIILEAKYSINNDQQLQDAFEQARSYALRLNSNLIILADRDFVWVFKKHKDDFLETPVLKHHWNELIDSDHLHELKTAISNIKLQIFFLNNQITI